jgi:hypothetical protein
MPRQSALDDHPHLHESAAETTSADYQGAM